jgi:hypothetical protein
MYLRTLSILLTHQHLDLVSALFPHQILCEFKQRKLLCIISVHFKEAAGLLLTIYCALVRCFKENENTTKQYFSYL